MTQYIRQFPKRSVQPIDVDRIEQHYDAVYVGDFCIKDKRNNWSEIPVAVFYQPTPNLQLGHKHYFGIFSTPYNETYICDATSAFEEPITGAVADNGEIIYSRWRHDYQTSEDETVIIDGGRDYCRTNTNNLIELIIDQDKLVTNSNG